MTCASHSSPIVRNVTRDRVGALLPDAATFRARISDALRRDICPSVSYRSTRFVVPSGAISSSRQRIAHPFPFARRHPVPYCRFVRAIREPSFPLVGSPWFSSGPIVPGPGKRITLSDISSRGRRAQRERRIARTCRPSCGGDVPIVVYRAIACARIPEPSKPHEVIERPDDARCEPHQHSYSDHKRREAQQLWRGDLLVVLAAGSLRTMRCHTLLTNAPDAPRQAAARRG